jgi:hypothetical protein
MEMPSVQAGEFGAAMMLGADSIVVSAMSGTGDCMAPGGGFAGISGVAGGNVEPLVRASPGEATHELPGAKFPGEDAAGSVPVVLPAIEPKTNTGIAGARIIDELVLVLMPELAGMAVEPGMRLAPVGFVGVVTPAERPVPADVTLATDGDSSTVAAEQLKLVPGRVGSCANGGVDNVVAGAPGTVAAEKRLVNGPGPVRGEDTIAPGVVGSPIAVVPTVDVCARQPPQLSVRIVVTSSKLRMSDQLRASS